MDYVTESKVEGVKILGGGYNRQKGWEYLASAAIGSVAGYWARGERHGHGHDHGGHGGHCGEVYNHGCCSENTPVNRFELEQTQKLACKDSEIAELRAEKYANKAAKEALLEANAYTDKMIDNVYRYVSPVVLDYPNTKTDIAVNNEKIHCLQHRDDEIVKDFNKALHDQWKLSKEAFVEQPKARIVCCAKFKDCDCNTDAE